MGNVLYQLGALIPLNQILPNLPGVPVGMPAAFVAQPGIYLILNQNNPQENRYMGISGDLRDRFAGRQGACFELGFPQNVLNNVFAFLGQMFYADQGAVAWTNAPGYVAGNLQFNLDGQVYDLEQMFIKAAQYAWPHGTITNTQKTGPLVNRGVHPITIQITWMGTNPPNNATVTIPVGGQLA